METSTKLILAVVIAIVGIIVIATINPFTTITAGHRGVVLQWGAVTGQTLGEGIHWVTPIAQDVVKMDVRVQKEEVTASAASKDMQSVSANIAVNSHLDPTKVHLLYQEVGKDYAAKIIAPAIQESVKAVTAKYTSEELIIKREQVKDDMKVLLTTALSEKYIFVDNVLITNFRFSAEFNKAIESKQTAQQEALRAKNELEKVKAEAEQRVAQAQAEAQAIRLQSDAANNPNYVQLKALEVQAKAIEKWNGHLPQQFVPGSALPFLNIK